VSKDVQTIIVVVLAVDNAKEAATRRFASFAVNSNLHAALIRGMLAIRKRIRRGVGSIVVRRSPERVGKKNLFACYPDAENICEGRTHVVTD
jgi:hypothetical protein